MTTPNARVSAAVLEPSGDVSGSEAIGLRIRQIVSGATTLEERVTTPRAVDAETDPGESARLLAERWRRTLSADPDALERRLSWDGIPLDRAMNALRSQLPWDGPLPAWAQIVMEYAATAGKSRASAELDRSTIPTEPLAFEDVLIPFVAIARHRLASTAGPAYRRLTSAAQGMLERGLLKHLCWLCERSLGLEFSIYRVTHPPAIALTPGAAFLYRSFVEDAWSDGLAAFFSTYPVLARLVGTAVSDWVRGSVEMLCRLRSDLREIRRRFRWRDPPGQITAVYPMLSDLHDGGRAVCAITFGSGVRIVYKPKDVGLEKSWNDLLRWINARAEILEMTAITVLPRHGYGWAEYVEAAPARTDEEWAEFSRRAGMLSFLAYLLDANDLHFENVLRCGPQPVLIDLETLLHPWAAPMDSLPPLAPGPSNGVTLRNSVLRSGLLPVFDVADGGPDLSGFRQGHPLLVTPPLRWTSVNTDVMTLSEQTPWIQVDTSSGGLAARPLDAAEVVRGFRELYMLALAWRTRWAEPDSPLNRFASQRVRFVFRATGDYARLLHHALKPSLLRDGALRSITLEALYRVAFHCRMRPVFWPVLKSEQRVLEQGDVPLFTACTDSVNLVLGPEEVIPNYFLESGSCRLRSRLQSLGEYDLQHQIEQIREALCGRSARDGIASHSDSGGPSP